MSNNHPYAFINNEIVSSANAKLHVSDLSIQRGYGVFDFFKINDGHVFFLDEYLDRFYFSAETMKLAVPYDRSSLKSIIAELIKKNNMPESGIKIILTGGYSDDGYNPSSPNLIMTHHKLLLPGAEVWERGISIITHEYVREFPEAKTINYSTGIWLLNKVRQHQATDVLYVKDGIASEFPRCNFFMVTSENQVVTPDKNVLRGITRKNVLALAEKKYKTVETSITLDDIYKAKEAFLTSTTKRIVPIVKVNDVIIGDGKPGKVSLSLLHDLKALEEQDFKTRLVQI